LEEKMMRIGRGSSGFTLFEVVTVIVILGIMAAAVSVKFLAMDPVNLNSETDTVKSHIRYAQFRAMNTNTVWGINISSATQYSLFQNGSTADTVKLPGQDALTISLPTGTSFGSTGIISFDTWGKPYTDAGAAASQSGTRTITLSYGSSSKNITITQNTGFIP
jgi:MSHA pilin protein MshC